jgi:hypothetical protein
MFCIKNGCTNDRPGSPLRSLFCHLLHSHHQCSSLDTYEPTSTNLPHLFLKKMLLHQSMHSVGPRPFPRSCVVPKPRVAPKRLSQVRVNKEGGADTSTSSLQYETNTHFHNRTQEIQELNRLFDNPPSSILVVSP